MTHFTFHHTGPSVIGNLHLNLVILIQDAHEKTTEGYDKQALIIISYQPLLELAILVVCGFLRRGLSRGRKSIRIDV